MAFNRLDGTLDSFASAIEPARKTNPQMEAPKGGAGHRKLKSAAFFPGSSSGRRTAAAADPVSSSLALGKKLLGTREDWSILQPGQALQQTFTMDTQVGVCCVYVLYVRGPTGFGWLGPQSSGQVIDERGGGWGQQVDALRGSESCRQPAVEMSSVSGLDGAGISITHTHSLTLAALCCYLLPPPHHTQAIEALATGQAHAAGRRLMQAVTSAPAAGGATTSTVSRPPILTGGAAGGDLWARTDTVNT